MKHWQVSISLALAVFTALQMARGQEDIPPTTGVVTDTLVNPDTSVAPNHNGPSHNAKIPCESCECEGCCLLPYHCLVGRLHLAHARLHNKWNEFSHLKYLKSNRGGTAEYTHQWNLERAMGTPWHGQYYHRAWGTPLALVVPPTSQFQTRWGWGVGQTTSTPLYHQFARPYPGPVSKDENGNGARQRFLPTPAWPSHTDQFGVYYIRGPW